jgi:hypothetical protein
VIGSPNNDALRRSHFFDKAGLKLSLPKCIEFAPCRLLQNELVIIAANGTA